MSATHKFSVCGVTCVTGSIDGQWVKALRVLELAFGNGAIEKNPLTKPHPYALGCSKTGDIYLPGAAVNLGLYGGDRKFFVNMLGPTRAT